MSAPVLWHFAISHFTEKARWALDFKHIPHVRKLLFVEYPIRSWWRTGQMRLPILFADGKAIRDSSRIIEFLEQTRPVPPLYPEDPSRRQRALELEEFFDEELGPHIRAVLVDQLFQCRAAAVEAFGMGQSAARRRLLAAVFPVFRKFYEYRHDMNPASISLGRAKLAAAIEHLEAEIGPEGYLVGDRFTVADLAAASLLYPIALPPEYPYAFPDSSRAVLEEMAEPWKGGRAQSWVREMYRSHRGTSSEIAA